MPPRWTGSPAASSTTAARSKVAERSATTCSTRISAGRRNSPRPHAARKQKSSARAGLGGRLGGRPCQPVPCDVRVKVVATGVATYPGVTVVCGSVETDAEDPSAVTNPTVIVEVLSDSTEAYDHGDKFEHYRQIPTQQ